VSKTAELGCVEGSKILVSNQITAIFMNLYRKDKLNTNVNIV
jgi:hypothetical protein